MKTRKYVYLTVIVGVILCYSFLSGCKKEPVVPTVTTGQITQITKNSATGSGDATADGGAEITLKGLCWSTSPDPTIQSFFINASTTGTGSFNCNLFALSANTQYYVRAFAVNSAGTAYGNTVTFTSLPEEVPENVPVVSTAEVSNVTTNSAACGGVVTSDGGSTVTARGVCWSENITPTVADSKTVNGTGAGTFTSDITGLTDGTMYYVRAYATNANGTGYGSTMSFTTIAIQNATVVTVSASGITATSAISGGNITDDGNAAITARGVCWGTTQNPTLANSFTTDGTGAGSFTSNISGLNNGTTYYARAYATNSSGTAYGNQITFTTLIPCTSLTDSRDGNSYQAVQIGNQCWMAENLAYLPSVVGPGTGSVATLYYYVYGYDGTVVADAKATANYDTYGVLYNWSAAMNGATSSSANPSGVQGVCPAGWHLPSDAEWTQLTDYLGGESVAGGKLKETGTTHWSSPNTGTTNETGFTALPGGYRYNNGSFYNIGYYGYWWSATEFSTSNAWDRSMLYSYSNVIRHSSNKEVGFSVRCVRD